MLGGGAQSQPRVERELHDQHESERPGSNGRPPAWHAGAPPTELRPPALGVPHHSSRGVLPVPIGTKTGASNPWSTGLAGAPGSVVARCLPRGLGLVALGQTRPWPLDGAPVGLLRLAAWQARAPALTPVQPHRDRRPLQFVASPRPAPRDRERAPDQRLRGVPMFSARRPKAIPWDGGDLTLAVSPGRTPARPPPAGSVAPRIRFLRATRPCTC